MTAKVAPLALDPALEIPVTPSVEGWRAMSPRARQAHHEAVIAALQREAELMPEGRPHSYWCINAYSVLGDFFQRIGRRIYLPAELPVLYPDEPAFAPDLIAVLDVEDPGPADTRMGWVVAEEGRGPDLAMEILHAGDRQKDLVVNVARFARLGIPEYFVYDRLNQRLYGYRLPHAGARAYQSIPSRSGRLRSNVLELELGLVDDRLRFFYGEAVIPEARELIGRLDALVEQRERRIEEEIQARQAEERSRREAEARVAALEAELASLRARLKDPG